MTDCEPSYTTVQRGYASCASMERLLTDARLLICMWHACTIVNRAIFFLQDASVGQHGPVDRCDSACMPYPKDVAFE